jgi:hypothetical protein
VHARNTFHIELNMALICFSALMILHVISRLKRAEKLRHVEVLPAVHTVPVVMNSFIRPCACDSDSSSSGEYEWRQRRRKIVS